MVALNGRPRGKMNQSNQVYNGTQMGDGWGNEYYKLLIEEIWVSLSENEVKADKKDRFI